MQFSGSTEFLADRDRVWSFLIDLSRLGPCSPIPIQPAGDGRYMATARIGGGLLGATVRAELVVSDIVDRERARISGRGGASGTTLDVASTFALRDGEIDGTTVVDWQVDLTPRGAFAGAISNLIGQRAESAIEQALACIHRQIEG